MEMDDVRMPSLNQRSHSQKSFNEERTTFLLTPTVCSTYIILAAVYKCETNNEQ